LDHPNQRLAAFASLHHIVEEIPVAEAAAMRDALGIKLVQRGTNFLDLTRAEEASDYGISGPQILAEIGLNAGRFIAPECLRTPHYLSPTPRAGYSKSLTFPLIFRARRVIIRQ
jgi:hypothetical protein